MKNWKSAILATTMLVGAAQPAMAQTWGALGGTELATSPVGQWSVISRGGPNCNVGPPTSLTNQYTNGPIGGRYGNQPGNQPLVARNFDSAPYTDNGVTFGSMAANMVLHPANNGDCAILRYTVPAWGAGLYTVNATFRSVDANSIAGAGDGANAMVLVNGSVVGSVIDTRRGPGEVTQAQIRMCPGNTIDFAVHMKTEMRFDTTGLAGNVQRTGDINAAMCATQTGGGITTGTAGQATGIDSTLLAGATEVGDPITMTGTPNNPRSNCCGPWAGVDIIPSLMPNFPTGAGGPYTMTFTPSAAMNAQMSAWLNYLHALNPAVTQLTMSWQAANLGTGNTAATSGTTIGAAHSVTWNWTNSGVTMTGGGFWTGAPFPLTTWIGFQTTLSVNGGQAGAALLGPDCRTSWSAWRAQPQQITQGGGNGGTGRIIFETMSARGQVQRTQPIQVRANVPIETSQIRIRN